MKKLLTILTMLLVAVAMPLRASASDSEQDGTLDVKGIIFEHLGDHYGWDVPFCHGQYIPLPCIVRDYNGDWHCFSSDNIMHGGQCEGFYIASEDSPYKNKIVGTDANGKEYRPLDISITKNVAGLFICATIVCVFCFSICSWYKRDRSKAPRRLMGAFEALIEFVYNGVIRSTLGDKAKRFGPYLLTVFFLIFVLNLMGLIVIFPGGANITGNLAVTLVLAIFTFLYVNVRATKHYWKDVFWPEVPIWLKCPLPIMQVIEVFSIFTKPAALTVRLFANMMGGHMIVITLTVLIFIFAKMGAIAAGGSVVVSLAFSIFMLLLDCLVSFIQAYVFTMLSTIFILLSHEEGEHEEK